MGCPNCGRTPVFCHCWAQAAPAPEPKSLRVYEVAKAAHTTSATVMSTLGQLGMTAPRAACSKLDYPPTFIATLIDHIRTS
jgi:hypothetical protein